MESTTRPVPSLQGTCLLAGIFFLADTVVTGVPFCAAAVLTVGNLLLLVRLMLGWRQPALRRRRAWSLGIYSGAAIASLVATQMEAQTVHRHALEVIAGCERYVAREGTYPAKLADLVPRDLPQLPSARRALIGEREFRYFLPATGGATGYHALEYTSAPPFARMTYLFETKTWGWRD